MISQIKFIRNSQMQDAVSPALASDPTPVLSNIVGYCLSEGQAADPALDDQFMDADTVHIKSSGCSNSPRHSYTSSYQPGLLRGPSKLATVVTREQSGKSQDGEPDGTFT
jgi:hypothetical protein